MIKRIAIACPWFPLPSETFILHQVTGFMEMGYNVEIFPYQKVADQIRHPEYTLFGLDDRVFPAVIPPSNIVKRYLQAIGWLWRLRRHWQTLLKTLNPLLLGRQALNLTVFYGALAYLQRPSFDAVIAHFGETGIGLSYLKKCGVLTVPLLTYFHGYDLQYTTNGLSTAQKRYRVLFKYGDILLTNSNFSLNKLFALGAPHDRSYVITVPIHNKFFTKYHQKRINDSRVVSLLTIGRLIQWKGHIYVLKALAIIRKSWPEIQFNYIIIGEGPERSTLMETILSLDLDGNVKLLGVQDGTSIFTYLKSADIYIHPSVTVNARAENQGLAIAEAQAMGVPVVAFASGGIPEYVKADTGILVPEGDIPALAKALALLSTDPERRRQMGQAAKAWAVKTYNTPKQLQKILDTISGGQT